MRSLRVLVFIGVVVAAVIAKEETVSNPEDEVDAVEEAPVNSLARSIATGRTFDEMSKKFWKWMGYEDYDYEEYEYYQVPVSGQASYGYGLPSAGYIPPSAGGLQSTYSSYVPVQQHFAHTRDDSYDDNDDDWSLTDMMFDMAVTIVPIGLLLSALPTGLFTFAIRRRSFDDSNLLLDTMEPNEVNRIMSLLKSDLTDRRCQEELFCELSRIGEHDEASLLQKAFFYVSTLTPDFLAGRVGMERLFRTTRSGYCQALQCPSTSILEPPKLVHQPTDTNQIAEVVRDAEKDATELSKE